MTDHTHRSFLFLLEGQGIVSPVDLALYRPLASRQTALPRLAGSKVRLADWYVEMDGARPVRRVSEWYGWIAFDDEGRLDPSPDPAPMNRDRDNVDPSALPDADEIQRMRDQVFGPKEDPP